MEINAMKIAFHPEDCSWSKDPIAQMPNSNAVNPRRTATKGSRWFQIDHAHRGDYHLWAYDRASVPKESLHQKVDQRKNVQHQQSMQVNH